MTAEQQPELLPIDPDKVLGQMLEFLTMGVRTAAGYADFAYRTRYLINYLTTPGARLPRRFAEAVAGQQDPRTLGEFAYAAWQAERGEGPAWESLPLALRNRWEAVASQVGARVAARQQMAREDPDV
jgi:hypothetical protein